MQSMAHVVLPALSIPLLELQRDKVLKSQVANEVYRSICSEVFAELLISGLQCNRRALMVA